MRTYWDKVSADLKVAVVHPYRVELASGRRVLADALFPKFGAMRGMLVFYVWPATEGIENEVIDAGFGYTCFDQPSAESYDRANAMEMLCDWGWTGEPSEAPFWLSNGGPDSSVSD